MRVRRVGNQTSQECYASHMTCCYYICGMLQIVELHLTWVYWIRFVFIAHFKSSLLIALLLLIPTALPALFPSPSRPPIALAWHPDKCTNPNAKEQFQKISIAYTKLISAQSVGGKRQEDEHDDDGKGKRGDESHEMAAFMRMFMDLVGIFNEDQSLSEDGKTELVVPSLKTKCGMPAKICFLPFCF